MCIPRAEPAVHDAPGAVGTLHRLPQPPGLRQAAQRPRRRYALLAVVLQTCSRVQLCAAACACDTQQTTSCMLERGSNSLAATGGLHGRCVCRQKADHGHVKGIASGRTSRCTHSSIVCCRCHGAGGAGPEAQRQVHCAHAQLRGRGVPQGASDGLWHALRMCCSLMFRYLSRMSIAHLCCYVTWNLPP